MSSLDAIRWAERSRPLAGETESGDMQVVVPFSKGVLLAVIDGLGHGTEAAAAARVAAHTLQDNPSRGPAEQIDRCHAALRGTRGAAMLVTSVSVADGVICWAGIGNVEGWRLRGDKREAMISRAGVVGYQITAPRDRSEVLEPGDLVILATDGISSGFLQAVTSEADVDAIASAILEDHARAADDALVLVARYQPGAVP